MCYAMLDAMKISYDHKNVKSVRVYMQVQVSIGYKTNPTWKLKTLIKDLPWD